MSIAKVGFALLGVGKEDSAFCISILRFARDMSVVCAFCVGEWMNSVPFFLFFFWIQPRRSLYQQGINSEHLVGYQVVLLYSSGVRAIVEHFKLRKWIRVVLNLACPIGGARRPPSKVPRSSSKNLGKKCHLVSRTTTKTSLYAYAGRRLI